ncbi:MAG: carboxymuconolactone decarboxylase family protein [Halofilum sp. (in: g-proteobacteria)]|nr:carboxymuconolactone decarboxylase family protein [Halofilum sp. (in: g-proteobacteria)]
MTRPELPATAGEIAERFPDVWSAYSALGESVAEAGPLSERERRLVKIALAIGAGSEGAVHSHVRRAESEGLGRSAIEQVALLAIPTLGFPRAAAAMSWIGDLGGGRGHD